MNIWSKVITAMQDSVTDELPLDSQVLRILDDEVRNTTQSLLQLQQNLAKMGGQHEQYQSQLAQLSQAVSQYEGYAVKALEQQQDDLAVDIAKKIAELQSQQQHAQQRADYYQSQCDQLKQVIELTQENLLRLRQQIDIVRASENVHRAQQSVISQYSEDGKIPTAMDALQRLKQRQAKDLTREKSSPNAKNTATSNPLAVDKALQQRLVKAGIVPADPEVSDILERLKQRAEQPDNDNTPVK